MPDARVATQPPSELNSYESGSWPVHTPCSDSCLSKSWPMMPASMFAVMFTLSTHRIRFIWDVSRDTIILVSPDGHSRAPDTLVPPPNGMMTTLWLAADSTRVTTSS